jgi:6-phosphogluconate dehydrogenase
LLVDEEFKQAVQSRQVAWRFALKTGIELGVPMPAISASHLIQAQRDYFGAHTFERIDKPGVFHANWTEV